MLRLLLAALLCLLTSETLAQDHVAGDGQPNTYVVRIDDARRIATVDASLWQTSDVLAMFNVMPVEGLPNGQADLVEGLQARDAQGALVALKSLGEGDFAVQGGRRLHLH
jgi:hypothetical protein